MKRIIALCAFLISFSGMAMETPSSASQEEVIEIMITQPEQSKVGNLIQIRALDGDKQIGYITFKPRKETGIWELTSLSVHREYRQNHLAKELMQECIKYIKSQGGKLLVWKALPLDHTIKLHHLLTIYRRMIESIGYTMDSLTLGARKGTGLVQQVKMRLEL